MATASYLLFGDFVPEEDVVAVARLKGGGKVRSGVRRIIRGEWAFETVRVGRSRCPGLGETVGNVRGQGNNTEQRGDFPGLRQMPWGSFNHLAGAYPLSRRRRPLLGRRRSRQFAILERLDVSKLRRRVVRRQIGPVAEELLAQRSAWAIELRISPATL